MAFADHIGKKYPPYTVEVEKGRVKFFAQAIGCDDPVHTDADAAKAAGHPAIPAPPTFGFTVMMEGGGLFGILEELDI